MSDINVLHGKHVKTGDTIPKLRLKLMQDGEPFNLVDYSVSIKVRRSDADTNLIDTENNLTIESETRGIVEYSWQQGETDKKGTYMVEVVASHNTSNNKITFPNKGYTNIFIEEGL